MQRAAHGPRAIGYRTRTAHRAGGFDVVGHVRDIDDDARLAVNLAVERFRERLDLTAPNARVTDAGEHFRRREADRCGRHPIERVAVAEDAGLIGVLKLAGPFIPEGGG